MSPQTEALGSPVRDLRDDAERDGAERERLPRATGDHDFALLADGLPHIVWMTDPSGTVEYGNQRLCDYVGRARHLREPADWLEVVHPDDRAGLVEAWRDAARAGAPWQRDYRLRRADGVYRWHRGSGRPRLDERGALVRWLCDATDIDDWKRADDARARAELRGERLRRVTATLSEALSPERALSVAMDEAVLLLDARSCAAALFGDGGRLELVASTVPLDGGRLERLRHLPEEVSSPVGDAARTGEVVWLATRAESALRYPHLVALQLEQDLHSWGAVPLDFEGRRVGAIAFARQTEGPLAPDDREFLVAVARQCAQAIERARLFRALESSRADAEKQRQRLRDLLEIAPVAIAVYRGPDHVVELANGAWRASHGDADDVLGQPYREAPALDGQRAKMDAVYATGRPRRLHEHRTLVRRPEDREPLERFFDTTIQPIQDDAGQTTGIIVVSVDVTSEVVTRRMLEREVDARTASERERLDALERAETANRVKDEFLATLSHELRTPLNAILGWAQLLRVGPRSEESRVRGLESIERNAKLQARLVEDIFDVSRIVTGKLRIHSVPVDLLGVVESAVEVVRPAANARGVTLAMDLDAASSAVMGDADRLRQVAWNLLSNAIKFTPRGGRVDVRLTRDATHAHIVVSDTGSGIAADFLPHVFEHFRQADSTATRSHGGLGLGLAIVRHLVELHGGTVGAASDGPGHGATFRVALPLRIRTTSAPTTPDGTSAAARSGAGRRLEGLRILVVDDEVDTRDLLFAALTDEGAEVRTAGSAAQALALFEEDPPQLLVSDLGMPGVDGLTLVRRVRSRATDASVPAIALTGYAGEHDVREALRAGFQMHIPKPIAPDELVVRLAKLARLTLERRSGG